MNPASFLPSLPLLFALALACANSTEYQRGAFRPPAAAPARPGIGAPAPGQPGFHPRDLPPSPHHRVLPETPESRKEPGLWSAEPPRASTELPAPSISCLGVDTPLSHEISESTDAIRVMNHCAASIDRYGLSSSFRPQLDQLSPEARQCLATQMMTICITAASMFGRWPSLDHLSENAWADLFTMLGKHWQGFFFHRCRPPHDKDSSDLFKRLHYSWSQTNPWRMK